MPITAESLSPSAIVAASEAPAAALAGDELRHHLALRPGGGAVIVRIAAGTGTRDGFRVRVERDSVAIDGETPRGALNGTYWLLEHLGWAWVEPGPGGVEFVPGKQLAEGVYEESPAFPLRSLILGKDALHDEWPDWMEWASRNRYNDIFFHDTPPSVYDRGGKTRPASAEALDADRHGWMFERWDADGPRIVSEARRCGLTLQFGGHHLPTLVPREEFAHHPDWFPLRQGVRSSRYNICTATPAMRDYLARRVEAFLARFPGADIYHFWGDDIRGGGWCDCLEGCGTSPSDQALAATNLVAESVARLLPGARVAHLAYHDTLLPPEATEPRDNVTALFAPRERCYAHALDDTSCRRNHRQYWEPLTRLAERFPGADRLQVFEYYSDAILFKGLAPTHLHVLPGDVRVYRSAGATGVGNLMVGDRPWVGPPWHAWWTARCLWNPDADANVELARFCEASFGPAGPRAREYYRLADRAYRRVLDLHDLEPIPRHDVLDFSDVPRTALVVKSAELREASAAFMQLRAGLGGEGDRIARERDQAEFVAAMVRHLAHRLTAWDAGHAGDRIALMSELELARAVLAEISAWDRWHNTAGYAVISRHMRRAMAYHLDEIRRLVGD